MKKKLKAFKKILSFIMAFITLTTTIFISAVSVCASDLGMRESTRFNYAGISPITNKKINHKIYRMKVEGKTVFFV